jgi:hypothetical protein
MTTIQQDLQAFFAQYPEVSIEQFAQMADVYAITVQRGLEGEKLWESSIERIKSVIDVYCTEPIAIAWSYERWLQVFFDTYSRMA